MTTNTEIKTLERIIAGAIEMGWCSDKEADALRAALAAAQQVTQPVGAVVAQNETTAALPRPCNHCNGGKVKSGLTMMEQNCHVCVGTGVIWPNKGFTDAIRLASQPAKPAEVGGVDERAEFQKAMNAARFFPAELDFSMTKSPSGKRDEYVNTHLESCWNGWQARAALAAQTAAPVDLSKLEEYEAGEMTGTCKVFAADDVRALLAASKG